MTESNQNEEPKIIVDSDWKQEAQREKEELDAQARETPEGGEIPAPGFLELIQMIVLQASIGLGGMQDPQTGQRIPPNLAAAKHYIDLLEVLDAKTQGNLDENEKALLSSTLHELRMAFVQVAGAGAGAAPEAQQETPDE